MSEKPDKDEVENEDDMEFGLIDWFRPKAGNWRSGHAWGWVRFRGVGIKLSLNMDIQTLLHSDVYSALVPMVIYFK